MEFYSVLQSFTPEETLQLLKVNSYTCFFETTFHFDTNYTYVRTKCFFSSKYFTKLFHTSQTSL